MNNRDRGRIRIPAQRLRNYFYKIPEENVHNLKEKPIKEQEAYRTTNRLGHKKIILDTNNNKEQKMNIKRCKEKND